ncbi:MAG: hypothetical protein JWM56_1294 [Candidatus Peribacteria bacterium]|nr:hypothetical protein [Candidatus Peribacteria bacterium]
MDMNKEPTYRNGGENPGPADYCEYLEQIADKHIVIQWIKGPNNFWEAVQTDESDAAINLYLLDIQSYGDETRKFIWENAMMEMGIIFKRKEEEARLQLKSLKMRRDWRFTLQQKIPAFRFLRAGIDALDTDFEVAYKNMTIAKKLTKTLSDFIDHHTGDPSDDERKRANWWKENGEEPDYEG